MVRFSLYGKMKKILFTTAYTNHSKEAFRYAQQLAYHFGASITVVHVYPSLSPIFISNGELTEYEDSYPSEASADHQWQEQVLHLQAFVEELTLEQFQDIEIDYIATDGDVVEQLLEIQQTNQFDLVIMGMRRHNRLGRLFGNTTYAMIDQVDCPLLLIPPDTHFMGIEKMIYATAFELGEVRSIDWLLDWCLAFDSRLHILHITSKEEHGNAMRNMVTMMEHFQKENEAEIINFQILDGKVADLVKTYTSKQHADLLTVHHRKRGFWQRLKEASLTKQLSEDLKVPLLVLK